VPAAEPVAVLVLLQPHAQCSLALLLHVPLLHELPPLLLLGLHPPQDPALLGVQPCQLLLPQQLRDLHLLAWGAGQVVGEGSLHKVAVRQHEDLPDLLEVAAAAPALELDHGQQTERGLLHLLRCPRLRSCVSRLGRTEGPAK
jgi:hypothetical protein